MLCLFLEHRRFDWTVDHIERIQQMLQICLVDFVEEILDAFVVTIVVHHNKANLAGGDEC